MTSPHLLVFGGYLEVAVGKRQTGNPYAEYGDSG